MEIDREQVIRYSRLILRKLGHSLPKSGWIQTCSSPANQQLAAFCKHCKNPYSIWGPFSFVSEKQALTDRDQFMIFQINNDSDYETNRAWKENRAAGVHKNVITSIGYRDFNPGSAYHILFAMMGKNPPASPDVDPEEILKNKIKGIDPKYVCQKLRAWT